MKWNRVSISDVTMQVRVVCRCLITCSYIPGICAPQSTPPASTAVLVGWRTDLRDFGFYWRPLAAAKTNSRPCAHAPWPLLSRTPTSNVAVFWVTCGGEGREEVREDKEGREGK